MTNPYTSFWHCGIIKFALGEIVLLYSWDIKFTRTQESTLFRGDKFRMPQMNESVRECERERDWNEVFPRCLRDAFRQPATDRVYDSQIIPGICPNRRNFSLGKTYLLRRDVRRQPDHRPLYLHNCPGPESPSHPLALSDLLPRARQRVGRIAITFGVAVTFAYFGVRDVCEMSTIIKLPAARDQRVSGPGNFITRAEIPNLSGIEYRTRRAIPLLFPWDGKKRFPPKKGSHLSLRSYRGMGGLWHYRDSF